MMIRDKRLTGSIRGQSVSPNFLLLSKRSFVADKLPVEPEGAQGVCY
jgi:hypothetical protein